MALPTVPDAAVGSVLAALIAAFVGFVGLVISKENKTSEFREAWIDSLRAELSAMIANVNAIRGAAAVGYETKQELFDATRELFIGANQAATAIRLRLNPAEAQCKAVLKNIDELEVLMNAKPIDIGACKACEDRMIANAHVLLKGEWVRVRRGEWTFVLAKWGGVGVAVLMLAWLAYTWAITDGAATNLKGSRVPNSSNAEGAASSPK
jgi:hypothetical protein